MIRQADLSAANLFRADLSGADLRGSNLSSASLQQAHINYARVDDAILTGCYVHLVNAWALKGDPQDQRDLVITWHDEATITVDDIRVAHFVYLVLSNPNIRRVIDTLGKRAVLILGRFTAERKRILDALRTSLRERGFVPLVFDFDRPVGRDLTETIATLAGMSLFVIADITNPRSAPLELQATVPQFMIPIVPIIQEGERPFAMFQDLRSKFDWVLPELRYDNLASLMAGIDAAIIQPAQAKNDDLIERKARQATSRNIRDYL
jgi:hypothetical protein